MWKSLSRVKLVSRSSRSPILDHMRPARYVVATTVFVLLALAHLHLVASVLLGLGVEPWIIFAGHLLCLIIALAAAVASWQQRMWAWRAIAAYGVAAAVLILSVGPAVQLRSEERTGLWFGAAAVLALAAVGAWWLRRPPRAR